MLLTAGVAFLAGCSRPTPTGFDSAAPEGRLNAIVDAAARRDRSAIPDLIRQLASDDAAVRMIAIRALERITGQTLGYHHAEPPWKRDDAIDRWVQWSRQEEPA